MLYLPLLRKSQELWNKGKLMSQKPPLKLRKIWTVRIQLQLQLEHRIKEVASIQSGYRQKAFRWGFYRGKCK